MGFAIVFGPCVSCKSVISFNPDRVPSVRVNGLREPVCRACIAVANPKRVANGLAPITILPGAYDAEPGY